MARKKTAPKAQDQKRLTAAQAAVIATLAARIEVEQHGDRKSLIAALEAEHGLKLGAEGADGATFTATMLGVTGQSRDSHQLALQNWCNAARRAVHKARAA